MFAVVRPGGPKRESVEYEVVELPEVRVHVDKELIPKGNVIRITMAKFLWQYKIDVEGFEFKNRGVSRL